MSEQQTVRDRAIEAVEAMGYFNLHGRVAAAVVDAVAPIIRADERERKMAAADIAFLDAVDARERLDRLRAQVEEVRVVESRVKGRRITVLVDRADVLALLEDGAK